MIGGDAERSRPRGILTEKDRRYLMDHELPDSKQARYERKRGTSERIKNGILDFQYLRVMPSEERRELFTAMKPGDRLYWSLQAIIGFVKSACNDAGIAEEDLLEDGLRLHPNPRSAYLNAVSPDETDYENHYSDWVANVDVEINYEYWDTFDPATLKEKFERGEELEPEELGHLVSSDQFDEEDFRELQDRRKDS